MSYIDVQHCKSCWCVRHLQRGTRIWLWVSHKRNLPLTPEVPVCAHFSVHVKLQLATGRVSTIHALHAL